MAFRFRFKGKSQTILTVHAEFDAVEMRRHPEYEEIDEDGDVVVTPLTVAQSTLKIRRESTDAPAPKAKKGK